MHLLLHLSWHGTSTGHTVRVTAPEDGVSGAELAAELERQLGVRHTATVDGVELTGLRLGVPPLCDSATVLLHAAPPRPGPAAQDVHLPRPADVERQGAGRARPRPAAPESSEDVTRLRVAAGTGAGTQLTVPRGTWHIDVLPDGPVLRRAGRAESGCSGVTVVVDASGVRLLPTGSHLLPGDLVRAEQGSRTCWLRVEHPRSQQSALPWAPPGALPEGLTPEEADPAHPLPLDAPTRHREALTMITGILPLVAGVGLALVTHWWFFLVFSGIGAVTTAAGWFGDRRTRSEQRYRVAAALDRDLRRCEHAAPSTAERVHRCQALVGADAGPGLPPAGIGTDECAARWVRVGHGARPAQVERSRTTELREIVHECAPVLADLARLRTVALELGPEPAAGLLHALVIQLFTGPRAFTRLTVSPDLPWQPPVPARPPAPTPAPELQRPLPRPTELQVLTADDARRLPARPDAVRAVLTDDLDAVLWDAAITVSGPRLRLTTRTTQAVPGLSDKEQRHSVDFLADTVSQDAARRAVAAWREAGAHHDVVNGSGIPTRVGTHELLVAAGPRERRAARPLRTPFGVSAHGVEHLHLDDENPHLLIAGTTGCGKSEVLRTIVAGLAHTTAPERLEFLFIDFKGGSALGPLTELPHVSTLLTDLGPHDVKRALVFLRSELQRRERVLNSHGFQHMTEAVRADPEAPVVRELVVVVDEARMLTEAFTEAGHELAVLAALGRSLGVHLVVATQRPQGALPADVRANITQALCLRVRTDQESVDVVRTPAAAQISPAMPGRGYLDRGDGAVEVQAAVLTRMVAPAPEPLSIDFSPAVEISARTRTRRGDHGPPAVPGSAPAPAGAAGGPAAAVQDITERWQAPSTTRASGAPDPLPGTDPSERAVPPALPLTAHPRPCPAGDVDLGPAENPADHWCGRARWQPWEDGPLALIGRPAAVRGDFISLLHRFVQQRPGDADPGGVGSLDLRQSQDTVLYLITASGRELDGVVTAEGAPLHPAVRGCARVDHPAEVAHVVDAVRAGAERRGTGRHASERGQPGLPRAVLAVEDWDRCCQVLRASAWAHLEDDLTALLASGAAQGLSGIVAGDRSLVTGRAAGLCPNHLHFPAGQAVDGAAHRPGLPPFTPHPHRGALSGPAAARCVPEASAPGERTAVVQLAQRDPAPHAGTEPRILSPVGREGGAPWPAAFPLPARWSPPRAALGGLLMGVTRDGSAAVHPWGPGATLIVAGPPRSGRSTFLTVAQNELTGGAVGGGVRGSAPGTEPHRVVRPVLRTAEDVHTLVHQLRGEDRPVTVLLDDADRLPADVLRTLGTAWTPHLTRRAPAGSAVQEPGVRWVVGIQLTDTPATTFPPLLTWRHSADSLLLRPRRAFDGEVFGSSLSGYELGGPPGRGFWLRHSTVEPLQCASPRNERPGRDRTRPSVDS